MSCTRFHIILMLSLLATCWLTPAAAQVAPSWRDSIAMATNDTARADYFMSLGREYMHKPGEVKSDLDSAYYCLDQARKLANHTKREETYVWCHY
ncbi:hypothetical protein WJU16_20270 [Chitinophaga pollutisoli]|uniref:Uncharacterized protein n=1 Tax=Chitinophaga pollutisoli TaxID=3133966 RepID=A0ABZ2YKU5_9BACT